MYLTEVEINKQTFPISFGMAALMSYEATTGKSAAAIEVDAGKTPITTLIDIIYHGLKDGARKAKKEFNISKEDLADFFDMDPQALNNCQEIFISSQINDPEAEKTGEQKKTKKKVSR